MIQNKNGCIIAKNIFKSIWMDKNELGWIDEKMHLYILIRANENVRMV